MEHEHKPPLDTVLSSASTPQAERVLERENGAAEVLRQTLKRTVYPYLFALAAALAIITALFLAALTDKIGRAEQRVAAQHINDINTELAKIRQTVTALEMRTAAIAPDAQDRIAELSTRLQALETGETVAPTADSAAKQPLIAVPTEHSKNEAAEKTLRAAVAPNLLNTALAELRQRVVEGEPYGEELDAAIALSTAQPAPDALLTALESRRDSGVVLLPAHAEILPAVLRTALHNTAARSAETGKSGATFTSMLGNLVEVRSKKSQADPALLRQVDTLETALRQNNRRAVDAALKALPETLRSDASVSPAIADVTTTLTILDGLEKWRRSVKAATQPAKEH